MAGHGIHRPSPRVLCPYRSCVEHHSCRGEATSGTIDRRYRRCDGLLHPGAGSHPDKAPRSWWPMEFTDHPRGCFVPTGHASSTIPVGVKQPRARLIVDMGAAMGCFTRVPGSIIHSIINFPFGGKKRSHRHPDKAPRSWRLMEIQRPSPRVLCPYRACVEHHSCRGEATSGTIDRRYRRCDGLLHPGAGSHPDKAPRSWWLMEIHRPSPRVLCPYRACVEHHSCRGEATSGSIDRRFGCRNGLLHPHAGNRKSFTSNPFYPPPCVPS